MSTFEPGETDPFFALVAGLNLTAPTEDFPTLQYHNHAVPLDPFSAEVFRDKLLELYTREVLPPDVTDIEQVHLVDAAVTHICEQLVSKMIEGSLGLRLHDWLVIRGAGALAIRIQGEDESEPFFLDPTRAVVGKLSGAGYSGYPLVDMCDGDPVLDEEGCFEGRMSRGPVLLLEDVTMCDPESGDTTMSADYEWVVAPLAVKSLQFNKPLHDLSLL